MALNGHGGPIGGRKRWATLAGAAALLATVGVATPAIAATVTVGPDSLTTEPAPGITLSVPADGRIAGNGFAGAVTGYRFTDKIGFGSSTRKAANGQELLSFGLRTATEGQSTTNGPKPTATFTVDGQQQTLPAGGSATSPTYYLASIPTGTRDATVTLTANGFSQTFSFTTGRREGTQPVVLYRSVRDWQAADPLKQNIVLPPPPSDPNPNLADAGVDMSLDSADVTWFGPDSPSDTPIDPKMAWLELHGTAEANQTEVITDGSQLNYLTTLPASAVTLTIPGQPPIPARITGQGGPDDESGTGLFGGDYSFQVPADLTTATVTITPGTVQAESNYLGTPGPTTVTGSATFPLSFSTPSAPPAPPAGNPSPSTIHPTRAARAVATTSSGGGGGFSIAPFLEGMFTFIVLVAAAGLVFLRRRRPAEPVVPVAWAGPAALQAIADPLPLRPGRPPEPARTIPPATMPEPSSSVPAPPPPAAAVLAEVPGGPSLPPDGQLEVLVFGPPNALNWPVGSTPPAQSALELLIFLALHPG